MATRIWGVAPTVYFAVVISLVLPACSRETTSENHTSAAEASPPAVKPAATPPNMPPPNPWLADSVYPTSHFNPAATDSVVIAGPVGSRNLTAADVATVPTLVTSNPTMKRVGGEVIAFASGAVGVQKIRVTGDAFEAVGGLLPYPGFERSAAMATPAALNAALKQLDAAYRAKDETKILGALEGLGAAGLNMESGINGVYNLFDRDGNHYCVYGGTHVLKTTDGNVAGDPPRIVKTADVAKGLPADVAKSVTRIIGLNMTYDGFLAAAAPGALIVLDRDLNVKASVTFNGEAVDNSIVIDENNGIYVVTEKHMNKVIWNGTTLSTDEKDGAWSSPYDSMPGEKALAMGAISRGSGTTPTLMGFGSDPDKLIVIADAAETGSNAVAFWRDAIPAGFKQKPGTQSNRIADQIRIDISQMTIEPSPNVLGYGVAFLNSTYPKPLPAGPGNAFTGGITRPAPMGIQKFIWNPDKDAFEKAWINHEVDNTDIMVPVVSAPTGLLYAAHKDKDKGVYQYLGLDWSTGEIKSRWTFPDDSRRWNALGGITTIMENGDLMIGGVFAVKRLKIGGRAEQSY